MNQLDIFVEQKVKEFEIKNGPSERCPGCGMKVWSKLHREWFPEHYEEVERETFVLRSVQK